jgi:DNA repair exonuclease SbcCD nuclease subunit
MILNNKICCVSDIHIGVHQNSSMWHTIAIDWAKWLRDELREKDITDIIICGDLFHYRDEISVNTIHVTTKILSIWKEFNIGMIVGNHDSYYKDRVDVNSLSILTGWDNITVFDTATTIESSGKTLTFCPWGTKVYEIPESDIVFGHFEINTFKLNQFKICDHGISSSDLLSKSNLIITGHFHLREERQYDNGTILYIGSPFQMDFGDVGDTKGYYILDVESSKYEFFKNNISPNHVKLKLSTLVREKKITNKVKRLVENNIIRFIVDKNITPDEIEIILAKLSSIKPATMNVEYSINFDRFGLCDDDEYDLSGVDIPTAIEEFINILDIEGKSKKEIIQFTLDLYRRCK